MTNIRYVTSVHGIRTYAKWQMVLSDFLGETEFTSKTYNYDYFALWKFLLAPFRQREIDQFRKFYNEFYVRGQREEICERPSIVAHSFGTFIVGYGMLHYPEIKLDRLILCGSILEQDFPWSELLERGQVNAVRNEYGIEDQPVRFAKFATHKCGPSGQAGFHSKALGFEQERFRG